MFQYSTNNTLLTERSSTFSAQTLRAVEAISLTGSNRDMLEVILAATFQAAAEIQM